MFSHHREDSSSPGPPPPAGAAPPPAQPARPLAGLKSRAGRQAHGERWAGEAWDWEKCFFWEIQYPKELNNKSIHKDGGRRASRRSCAGGLTHALAALLLRHHLPAQQVRHSTAGRGWGHARGGSAAARFPSRLTDVWLHRLRAPACLAACCQQPRAGLHRGAGRLAPRCKLPHQLPR